MSLLTVAEETVKARSLENKFLAEGVGLYLQRLQQQTKHSKENGSPYKGLLEYRLEDAETFFGRNVAIRELLSVMDRGALPFCTQKSRCSEIITLASRNSSSNFSAWSPTHFTASI